MARLTNRHSTCPTERLKHLFFRKNIVLGLFCSFEWKFYGLSAIPWHLGFKSAFHNSKRTFQGSFWEIFWWLFFGFRSLFLVFWSNKFRPGCWICLTHVRRNFLRIIMFFRKDLFFSSHFLDIEQNILGLWMNFSARLFFRLFLENEREIFDLGSNIIGRVVKTAL